MIIDKSDQDDHGPGVDQQPDEKVISKKGRYFHAFFLVIFLKSADVFTLPEALQVSIFGSICRQ
jgi:hypothetical protein